MTKRRLAQAVFSRAFPIVEGIWLAADTNKERLRMAKLMAQAEKEIMEMLNQITRLRRDGMADHEIYRIVLDARLADDPPSESFEYETRIAWRQRLLREALAATEGKES
jgi:hypothetical protein